MRRQRCRLLLAALLLVSSLPAARGQGGAVTLAGVRGQTLIRRADGSPEIRARRGLTLAAGDIVRTGPDGGVLLDFPDGSQLRLPANSAIRIRQVGPPGNPERVSLEGGRVWARVTRGRPSRFEAGRTIAGVRSTEFDLQLEPDSETTLTVAEGEVRFVNERGSVLVREGQQSVSRPGQAPTAPAAVDVPFIFQWINDVQPVVLLLETTFVSQDPERLAEAQREAEAMPPGPERSLRLGDLRHDRGELPEALEAYEAAGAAAGVPTGAEASSTGRGVPTSFEAELRMKIGHTLLELDRLPEAEEAFRRSLALAGPGATTRLARAGRVMTLLNMRRDEAALLEARSGVEQDARSGLAHTVLALAQIRQGEREAGRRSLERALELNPDDAQALAWQSFLLRAEERLVEADADARRAVELAPYSSLARQALADSAFGLGRIDEAREAAQQAVALNPRSPGARVSLGRVLLQVGEIERAEREANMALALDPALERARFFRGVVLAQQNRLGGAVRELEHAIRLDPGYVEARAFLARVYVEQGRQRDAVAVVQEVVRSRPDFAPARAALGDVYWRAGRLRESAAEYRAALAAAPDNVQYHLQLSWVYMEQNRFPDALEHGLAAVDAAPESAEAHARLGVIYREMNNAEQAEREFRLALSLSPENALARLGLGVLRPGFREAQRDIGQAMLRDPAVIRLIGRPGITTQIAPFAGSHQTVGVDLFHRDQYARGRLRDLTFASQIYRDNYRNSRQERESSFRTSIAGMPSHRLHVLGQYAHFSDDTGLPGATFDPHRDDRAYDSINEWGLATRYQVDARTNAWFHMLHRLFRSGRQNPGGLADGTLLAHRHSPDSELGIEGRVDHRWGRGHTTSFVVSALREDFKRRSRSYGPLRGAFVDEDFSFRDQIVEQTLQDHYRPGPRLSLILGIKNERFTEILRSAQPGETASREDLNETNILPYGQLTYALSRRDLVRMIAHRRTRRFFSGTLLDPSEAFVIGEAPAVAVDGSTTNYELDYERRLSRLSFAKLFLFRSDVDRYRVAPDLEQTVDVRGFTVPKARLAGIGMRYERQISRFLSGYLRYTYSEATDETVGPTSGRQLPFHPRSRAVLGLNYIDRAGSKLFLEAGWQSEMFADPIWSDREGFDPRAPRPTSPSAVVVNLRFGQEPNVRREWAVFINNIFDTETIDWPGFPFDGRSYFVQYTIRF